MRPIGIIEQIGTFKDHFFAIRLNSLGFRCGYVRPLFYETFEKIKKQYDDGSLSLKCHGGITFIENISKENNFLPPGNWIGFDCAHAFDLPDIDYVSRLFELSPEVVSFLKENYKSTEGEQRTIQYVINNCLDLIEQLILEYQDCKRV